MPTPFAILDRALSTLIQRVDADGSTKVDTLTCAVADEFGVSFDDLDAEYARWLRDAQLEAFSADEEAVYGRDDDEPTYGPARLRDDGYYAKNDAGEYAWM